MILKYIRKFLAFFVASGILLLATPVSFAERSEYTDSEVLRLEEQLQRVEAEKKEASQKKKEMEAQKISELLKKAQMDEEMNLVQDEIRLNKMLLEEYSLQKEELQGKIATSEHDLEERQNLLKERLRISYEEGKGSWVETLIESKGIRDFLVRLERVQSMLNFDLDLIEEYRNSRQEYEEQLLMLAEYTQMVEQKMKNAEARELELQQLLEESRAYLLQLEQDTQKAEQAYKEAVKLEEQFNTLLEEKIEEYKKRQEQENSSETGDNSSSEENPIKDTEGFIWPLPATYSRISSGFGSRIHPVTGQPQFHKAIDIPAPYQTPIYAAASGKVIEIGSHYANGNYLLIMHEGELSTFYSHLSDFNVSLGDYVKQGEVIGTVGMTGWTTGYHLNFGVYKDGIAVNPIDYYDSSLYSFYG